MIELFFAAPELRTLSRIMNRFSTTEEAAVFSTAKVFGDLKSLQTCEAIGPKRFHPVVLVKCSMYLAYLSTGLFIRSFKEEFPISNSRSVYASVSYPKSKLFNFDR